MNPRTLTTIVAALAAAGLTAGCAPDDPYAHDRPATSRDVGRTTETRPAGELPGRAPQSLLDVPKRFPGAATTPQVTLARAARVYGNWTNRTTSQQLHAMAALSVGQARAELRQAATQATVDRQQTGTRSQATVEGITVRGWQAIVVTRERISAPDLPADGWRYRVTLAELEQRAGRWVISRWRPQP